MAPVAAPALLGCSSAASSLLAIRWQGALEAVSYALPLTYAYDALDRVTSDGSLGARGTADVLVLCGVILPALALGAATLRRRTP